MIISSHKTGYSYENTIFLIVIHCLYPLISSVNIFVVACNWRNSQVGWIAAQLTGDVSGLRVGLMKEGLDGAEDDVVQTLKAAVNSLKQLGVIAEEFSFPTQTDC